MIDDAIYITQGVYVTIAIAKLIMDIILKTNCIKLLITYGYH